MITFNGLNFGVQSQPTVTMSLSNGNLTLNYMDTEDSNLNVTILADSNPVENVFFYLEGIDYQIDESQFYLGSGEYQLFFPTYITQETVPGLYSNVELIALNENQAEIARETFTITIVSDDLVLPQITLLNPNIGDIINETFFKLEVIAFDETGWYDFQINIGNTMIYYLLYRTQHLDYSGLAFNTTHIYFNDWIDLNGVSTSNSDDIVVKIRDSSFNEASFTLIVEGDFVKPTVTWVSPTDQDIIKNLNLELEWVITDESNIILQELYLDGKIFKPNSLGLTPNDRVFSFHLVIPKDEARIILLTLKVYDESGNRGEASITLYYDPNDKLANNSEANQVEINQAILLGTVVLVLAILLGSIAFSLASKDVSDGSGINISKDLTNLIMKNPEQTLLNGFLELLINGELQLDTEERMMKNISAAIEKMHSAKYTHEVREGVFEISNVLAQAYFDDTLSKNMKDLLISSLEPWIKEIEHFVYQD